MRRVALLAVSLTGCSEMSSMSADMGVTPGGSQDIGYAREIIANGGIPTTGMFTAEGLFSEHDLPFDNAAACDQLLCPQAAAAAVDPVDGSGPQVLVQMGFGTNLSAETFHRNPLNLAVAVDVSGSMSGGKLEAVQDALLALVDELEDGDRMALVSFTTDARLEMPLSDMDEAGRDRARAVISSFESQDSTCIECGLEIAYGEVAPTAGAVFVEDRVMVFTDAQPNVRATDVDSFLGMARYYAAADIGVTLFGVGLDMGYELADAIAKTPGGNYFYLADEDAIRTVFDEEFDYLVSPVAYDLEVTVTPAEGVGLGEAYGAPMDEASEAIAFGASTLFLSSKNGGMGFTLVPPELSLEEGAAMDLGTFHLSYVPAEADEPVTGDLAVAWNGGTEIAGEETLADDLGVYKMGGLVDEYLALVAGATFCEEGLSVEDAAAQIVAAQDRLVAMSAHLEDAPLSAEADLMAALYANLEDGLDACSRGAY